MKAGLSILLILFSAQLSLGQVKLEKEYRCKKNDVPISAQNFIDSCAITGKVKWYIEENTAGKSFEAKFRSNGHKYSVEFSKEGGIQDVEIIVAENELSPETRQLITNELQSSFTRFKIRRLQKQYKGLSGDLINLIRDKKEVPQLEIGYELVVRGKEKDTYKTYEYFFSNFGKVLSKTQIIQRSTDHLEF